MKKVSGFIEQYLVGKGWTSPLKIGEVFSKYYGHTWNISKRCDELVTRGMLDRNISGYYRLKVITQEAEEIKQESSENNKICVCYYRQPSLFSAIRYNRRKVFRLK